MNIVFLTKYNGMGATECLYECLKDGLHFAQIYDNTPVTPIPGRLYVTVNNDGLVSQAYIYRF